jgi:hypothetical protein
VIVLTSETRLPFLIRFLRCTSFGLFPSSTAFGSAMHSTQVGLAAGSKQVDDSGRAGNNARKTHASVIMLGAQITTFSGSSDNPNQLKTMLSAVITLCSGGGHG